MPQKIKVKNMVSCMIPISPLLYHALLGSEDIGQNPVVKYEWESFNNQKKIRPGYFHLSNLNRVNQVMRVKDVRLMSHYNYELVCTHYITGIATITNAQNQVFKAYG